MGAFIERNPVGLVLLGQVQFDYTVNGVSGLALDAACAMSSFKRIASIEDELSAMSLAVKKRGDILQVYTKALADIGVAIGSIGDKKDDQVLTDQNAIDALVRAKNNMGAAGLSTSAFSGLNYDSSTRKGSIKVTDLRKLRENVKFESDQESNVLQRNTSVLQSVLGKRDSAVSEQGRLQKRLSKTISSTIKNIGR